LFCAPDSFSTVLRASGPVFKFYATRLIFGDTVGVKSCSSFALPEMFPVVQSASGPVFMFCSLGLIFGGTAGIGSRLQVLRSRTHFRRYRGRRNPFSCFARTETFLAVPRASSPIFIFCALGLIFCGTYGVGYHFHVLRAWTQFRRYRGRRVTFSCFARLD
jgi:hypothetical protein